MLIQVCKSTDLTDSQWRDYTSAFNQVFEKEFTADDFRHKYLLTIDSTGYHAFLVQDRKIVGSCSVLPFPYRIKGVEYLGKRYGEEKNAVFARSDIFCFPTFYHNETFGLVNLEAMQWGLPVVATPEGGIPDVVLDGETGFLVPQRNAEALADSLEVLLSDPELRFRMGKAGRRHYEANFTQSHFEERMRVILSEVIAT